MSAIEDMTLDLPDPIEADTAKLRTGCDDLETLREDMLGQSEDTYTQTCTSADKFTDLIAWDISSASGDELMAWEETSRALTHGAAMLRLWAEDIDTYLAERSSIERRWSEAKEWALHMEESYSDPMYHIRRSAVQALTPGMGNVSFENPVSNLPEVREELRSEHATHWGTLMGKAEKLKSDLRNGPSKETLERISEMGLLNGGELSIYDDQSIVPDDIKPWEDHPPHVVKAWWDSLSEEEREQAMEEDANHLRDLDGIPAVVRDRLNREHLDDESRRVRDEIKELEEQRGDPDLSWPDSVDLENDIEELEGQLSSMNDLNGELNESEGEDKYLLSFSMPSPAPDQQHGRLIVSEGNPDTADNVSTLVPGTGNTWEDGVGQMGRGTDLMAAADEADEEADHAVITWIGYDAPQGAEAGAETSALRGEENLRNHQAGLRATHEGTSPSHNTVIGHSYGSTLVGHAAQGDGGLNADGIALVGSPGANADHVTELGFPAENVHATTSMVDFLIIGTRGTVHGADPTGWGFEATEFESDWHSGHSDYFNRGSESWRNLGTIIAGGDVNQ